jgi:hypothetical protein
LTTAFDSFALIFDINAGSKDEPYVFLSKTSFIGDERATAMARLYARGAAKEGKKALRKLFKKKARLKPSARSR